MLDERDCSGTEEGCALLIARDTAVAAVAGYKNESKRRIEGRLMVGRNNNTFSLTKAVGLAVGVAVGVTTAAKAEVVVVQSAAVDQSAHSGEVDKLSGLKKKSVLLVVDSPGYPRPSPLALYTAQQRCLRPSGVTSDGQHATATDRVSHVAPGQQVLVRTCFPGGTCPTGARQDPPHGRRAAHTYTDDDVSGGQFDPRRCPARSDDEPRPSSWPLLLSDP